MTQNNPISPSDNILSSSSNNITPISPRANYKSIIKSFISRLVIIYAVSTFFKNPKESQNNLNTTALKCRPSNILLLGEIIDFYVYTSENGELNSFDNLSTLIWNENGIEYGNWYQGSHHDSSYIFSTKLPVTSALNNNGSLYAYFYVVKNGKSPNPKSSDFDPKFTFYAKKRLNKYKRKFYKKTHNLLSGETDDVEGKLKVENGTKSEILSHWHSNLTINLLVDNTTWVQGHIPHPIDEYIVFDEHDPCYYKPVLYVNDFWNLASDYQPINSSIDFLNLTLTFSPISLFKWQMYVSQNVKNKWMTMLTEGVNLGSSQANTSNLAEDLDSQDESKDAFKKALLDTNPYLLGLTIIVSIVHSVFEILAFKNDIQFWKSRQSLEGLSIRTVFFNIVSSLVVLLYVLDNETNFMVRVTVFIGMLIEIWKITKCVDIKLDFSSKTFGLLPHISFAHKSTYIESDTKKYDKMAFKYLSWLLFPLLISYSIYSMIYQEHKGWYSFVLNILYGFLLTFGFIMMTPQLFINYKMKSVAHLPWRMLTYKALNTFIDDIFAFVIHMPIMYRIGCFRDDIVFFIYLYQRWIYKIDMKRVNEFGTSGETHKNSDKIPILSVIDTIHEHLPITDGIESGSSRDSQTSEDSFEKINKHEVDLSLKKDELIDTPKTLDSKENTINYNKDIEHNIKRRNVHKID